MVSTVIGKEKGVVTPFLFLVMPVAAAVAAVASSIHDHCRVGSQWYPAVPTESDPSVEVYTEPWPDARSLYPQSLNQVELSPPRLNVA